MTKPTKRTRNRLTKLQVDEISLVDRPAVPESQFIIAKRDAATAPHASLGDVLGEAGQLLAKRRAARDAALRAAAVAARAVVDRLAARGLQ